MALEENLPQHEFERTNRADTASILARVKRELILIYPRLEQYGIVGLLFRGIGAIAERTKQLAPLFTLCSRVAFHLCLEVW